MKTKEETIAVSWFDKVGASSNPPPHQASSILEVKSQSLNSKAIETHSKVTAVDTDIDLKHVSKEGINLNPPEPSGNISKSLISRFAKKKHSIFMPNNCLY